MVFQSSKALTVYIIVEGHERLYEINQTTFEVEITK